MFVPPSSSPSGDPAGTKHGLTLCSSPASVISHTPNSFMRKPISDACFISSIEIASIPCTLTPEKFTVVPKAKLDKSASLCAESIPPTSKVGSASKKPKSSASLKIDAYDNSDSSIRVKI